MLKLSHMKQFFKKILVLVAVILAASFTTNLKPESASAAYDCRYFLGMVSWDCNVIEQVDNQDDLINNTATIAANVLTDLTVIAAYLVLGFVIYGGYLYIFSSGDPSKTAAGKKTITRALIGTAIVMLATVILNAIRIALLGNQGSFQDCVNSDACVGIDNSNAIVTNLLSWFIGTAGVVAVIYIVIGGISYMTSAGDSSKLQKAKNTILYALIGLVIVALAEIIVATVSGIIRDAEQNASLPANTTLIAKEQK